MWSVADGGPQCEDFGFHASVLQQKDLVSNHWTLPSLAIKDFVFHSCEVLFWLDWHVWCGSGLMHKCANEKKKKKKLAEWFSNFILYSFFLVSRFKNIFISSREECSASVSWALHLLGAFWLLTSDPVHNYISLFVNHGVCVCV